jgi:hypothetical protein
MLFFALMALAAAALAVAATRSNAPAEAEPEASPVVHFSWSVRITPKQPVVDARAANAVVPAAAAESVIRGASPSPRMVGLARARRAHRSPRVYCPRPRTLRLIRYEDGSARLICAGRVLARVSVPG